MLRFLFIYIFYENDLTLRKFGGILYLVKIGLIEKIVPFLPKKVIIMEGEIC